ncbi:Argonaute-binding protein 1 [Pseudocercospora fuligena]|uniref:Argonaute-binding protein 1 n=1 Tax=Pseudocercospora fuligena TaxID=685502 RepID=A0A8H6RLX3_9PEZI|nr:Argonaute-binding protein 1 [Pseudocercospora fuligena]
MVDPDTGEEFEDRSLGSLGAQMYEDIIERRESDSPMNATSGAPSVGQPPTGVDEQAVDDDDSDNATPEQNTRNDSTATTTDAPSDATEQAHKENEPPKKSESGTKFVDAPAGHEPSKSTGEKDQGKSSAEGATNDDQASILSTLPSRLNASEHKEDIIRQVEYYLGEENLPRDAHLLASTGPAGDGWVSISDIMGFRKMRPYKPPAEVKKILKLSNMLEVHEKGKWIRRRWPLKKAPTVTPKVDESRKRNAQLAEQPWMTKGMLKPTGFESKNANQGPLNLEEYLEERPMYDPEESFVARIDRAVAEYQNRRKFHEMTAKVFGSYLTFGGFAGGQNMFAGRLNDEELKENYDKHEIAMMKARWGVADKVIEGVDPDEGEPTWVVDFEGMTKAWLSSEFMQHFAWTNSKTVLETTNILRNFFSYLTIHDVCPEYKEDIDKAVAATHLADSEFPKLAAVDAGVPGEFNKACSSLYGGHYAQYRPTNANADWVTDADLSFDMTEELAEMVFTVGTFAYCTRAQLDFFKAVNDKKEPKPAGIVDESMGLEVTEVEMATEQANNLYDAPRYKNRFKKAGLLHCKRWALPHARPRDLPKHVLDAEKAKQGEVYKFIVDEDLLKHVIPGMKLDAIAKTFGCGFSWIDAVECVYPTFFTWTLNERAMDWKEPVITTQQDSFWVESKMYDTGREALE